MNRLVLGTFGLFLAALGACAPTLQNTSAGWHPEGAIYSIEPLPQGRVMPDGWALANYSKDGDHFQKTEVNDPRDLTANRTSDDGVLMIDTEDLHGDALGKSLDVLAERWITRAVVSPADDATNRYDDLVPPLVTEIHGTTFDSHGPGSVSAEAIHGRTSEVVSHQEIAVANGTGYELTADLRPQGTQVPDRKIYLAFLRPARGGKVIVVAYANSPTAFAGGASDASALARRVRF